MNVYSEEYKSKLCTADEAVKYVKSGMWVDYTMALGFPYACDSALARRKDELRDVKIRSCITPKIPEAVAVDPDKEHFTFSSWHFSAVDRKLYEKGLCYFNPMIYRAKPKFYREYLDVDVCMLSVAPMDENGYFSFSMNNSATAAIIEACDYLIVEVNPNLPNVYGLYDDNVHISRVDCIVEPGPTELMKLPKPAEAGPEDLEIARLVVEEMVDGSVIQLGIGSLPNAIGKMIADSDLQDLGMHTEMLVDAFLEIAKAGKLTNMGKKRDRRKGVWAFGIGSSDELYDWVRDNRALASAPIDYTNNPRVIAAQDNFRAINSCIEMDLMGQVCSESSGFRQITGTGGQLDFLEGAFYSHGGRGYVCFHSTFTDKDGVRHSRIKPQLPSGGIVTTPRTIPFTVVTEYGKLSTAGISTWERVEGLINLAHPDFREELISEAERMKVWRRSSKIVL